MAGIFGPVLVNYIRAHNVSHAVAAVQAYNVTMYDMAVLVIVGFFCNLFITSVKDRHYVRRRAWHGKKANRARSIWFSRGGSSASRSPGARCRP
jgi:hypothetical protein